MKGLDGKIAIVTGGSRGIGYAIVARLLGEGCKVVFTGRNSKTGTAAESALKEISKDVLFLCGDMADDEFCHFTAVKTQEYFGNPTFLVNNAFAFTARGVNGTRDEWRHVMECGPIAYAAMIREYVAVRDSKVPGAIVNMSSTASKIALPERWTYNAAKGAVTQLTKCAAMDLAPVIRVNTVSPGIVWTDEVKNSKNKNGDFISKDDQFFRDMHLIQRIINPEEIASVVAFMLSDESSAITGTDIFADGGYLAMGPEAKPTPNYTNSD